MRTSPMAPASSQARTWRMAGWNRVHIASIANTPLSRAAATTCFGTGQGGGEGLLDQHGLAGLDRGQGDGMVLRMRGGDVDDVDLVVVDQLPVGTVGAGDAVPGGEGFGPVARSRADRDQFGVRYVPEVAGNLVRDPAWPGDTPTHCVHADQPSRPGRPPTCDAATLPRSGRSA